MQLRNYQTKISPLEGCHINCFIIYFDCFYLNTILDKTTIICFIKNVGMISVKYIFLNSTQQQTKNSVIKFNCFQHIIVLPYNDIKPRS